MTPSPTPDSTGSSGYGQRKRPQINRAHSHESLLKGGNWFISQFVEIPRRSITVCFLSLSAKSGFYCTLLTSEAVQHEREISNAGR
jgi:hypothetical protein